MYIQSGHLGKLKISIQATFRVVRRIWTHLNILIWPTTIKIEINYNNVGTTAIRWPMQVREMHMN
jgi:hypothetical protein